MAKKFSARFHGRKIPSFGSALLFVDTPLFLLQHNTEADVVDGLPRLVGKAEGARAVARARRERSAARDFLRLGIAVVASVAIDIRIRRVVAACPFARVAVHVVEAPAVAVRAAHVVEVEPVVLPAFLVKRVVLPDLERLAPADVAAAVKADDLEAHVAIREVRELREVVVESAPRERRVGAGARGPFPLRFGR